MTNISDRKLKVAFFGTSDRSKEILNSLNSHFDLKFCLTKIDSKVGRAQISTPSGVKSWAIENNIPFYEVPNLKGENKQPVLDIITKHKVDYIVVADFSFIIPKEVIHNGTSTLINVHFSLLPRYRGASPVQFAILNGDKSTGITFQLIHEKMDMGDIICQLPLDMNGTENSEELYKTLFTITAKSLPQILTDYNSGSLTISKQDETNASYTYSKTNPKTTQILKEDARIVWRESDNRIYNSIRAFYPWPVSWTTLGELLNWHSMTKYELRELNNSSKRFLVKSAELENNLLKLGKVQVEGGKETNFESIINGYFKLK